MMHNIWLELFIWCLLIVAVLAFPLALLALKVWWNRWLH